MLYSGRIIMLFRGKKIKVFRPSGRKITQPKGGKVRGHGTAYAPALEALRISFMNFLNELFSFRIQNRELQIMRRLDHCNIVKLKYFFYSSGDKVNLYVSVSE